MTNPFEKLTTEAAIKSAYRKLSKVCHPDVRPASEKRQAEEEFGTLTRIYQQALEKLGDTQSPDWWHRDPSPPPPPPPGKTYVETFDLGDIDNFEFDNWGEALRTFICTRALLLYGGILYVKVKVPKLHLKIFGTHADFGQTEQVWTTIIPPNTANPVKIRLDLPQGPVVLTLVGRR